MAKTLVIRWTAFPALVFLVDGKQVWAVDHETIEWQGIDTTRAMAVAIATALGAEVADETR